MNDFTKKELKDIYWCCAKQGLEGWADVTPEFLIKIQHMIDDYDKCEHEPVYGSMQTADKLCGRCGEQYE